MVSLDEQISEFFIKDFAKEIPETLKTIVDTFCEKNIILLSNKEFFITQLKKQLFVPGVEVQFQRPFGTYKIIFDFSKIEDENLYRLEDENFYVLKDIKFLTTRGLYDSWFMDYNPEKRNVRFDLSQTSIRTLLSEISEDVVFSDLEEKEFVIV